jgi:LysM repeat protein
MAISMEFNTSIAKIKMMNHLVSEEICEGKKLKIPKQITSFDEI